MKRQQKIYVLLAISLIFQSSFSGNCQSINNNDSIPEALRPFIKAIEEPCVFKEIPDFIKSKPHDKITKSHAHEDIEMLQYLFDNAYSGRYYWEQNGFNFNNYYQKLHDFIDSFPDDTIDVKKFENCIYNNLYPINDGHTAIVGFLFQGLYRSVKPYYAEIILEKKNNKYIVIQSNQLGIKIGAEYLDSSNYLFKTLSKKGTEQFLIGTLSIVSIDTLSVKFSDGKKILSLHPSKLSNFPVDRDQKIVNIDTVSNIPVIRSSTFNWSKENVKYLESFIDYGKNLKDKPIFIWNLAGNWGGDANFPYRFIENFNNICQNESYELVLHSPAVNQCYWSGKNSWIEWPEIYKKALNDDNIPLDSIPTGKREKIRKIREDKKVMVSNPIKYWEIRMKPEKKYGNYKGKTIILVNNETGSAANDAVAASKSIPNGIIIGENTAPSYSIGNIKWYQLKNTLIVLWLPGNLGIHPDNKMEKGFFPDFWLDSNKPIDEIINWLNNPDSYQFKYLNE